jgi:hypothetical protein
MKKLQFIIIVLATLSLVSCRQLQSNDTAGDQPTSPDSTTTTTDNTGTSTNPTDTSTSNGSTDTSAPPDNTSDQTDSSSPGVTVTVVDDSNNTTTESTPTTPASSTNQTHQTLNSDNHEQEEEWEEGEVEMQTFGGDSKTTTTDGEIEYDNNSVNPPVLPMIKYVNATTNQIGIGHLESLSFNGCNIYAIKSNYKKMQLSIASQAEASKVMFTDNPTDTCSETDLKCPSSSKFCTIVSVPQLSLINTSLTLSYCADTVYMHVISQNISTKNSVLNINVNYDNTSPCVATGTMANNAIECAILSETACKMINPCLGDCVWADCNYDSGDGQKNRAMGLCLPSTVQMPEIQTRCAGSKDFSLAASNSIDAQLCTNVSEAHRKNTFAIVVYVVACMLFLMFIFSIWCYRNQLNTTRIAPFTPPGCCPDFIYPRPPDNPDQEQDYPTSYSRFDNDTNKTRKISDSNDSKEMKPKYPFGKEKSYDN